MNLRQAMKIIEQKERRLEALEQARREQIYHYMTDEDLRYLLALFDKYEIDEIGHAPLLPEERAELERIFQDAERAANEKQG